MQEVRTFVLGVLWSDESEKAEHQEWRDVLCEIDVEEVYI